MTCERCSDEQKLLGEIEGKLREARRLAEDYKRRGAKDLEEYYKGAQWALDFAIKSVKEKLKGSE